MSTNGNGTPTKKPKHSSPPRTMDDLFDSADDTIDEAQSGTLPMIHRAPANTGKNGTPVTGVNNVGDPITEDNKNSKMMPQKNDPTVAEKQPAPTGMLAWIGFGCCVMALASLCISFCSPYWLQTWPMSENKFRNIGLWQVCFHDYMQFKDDSQQIYSGCWWVFDSQTKYYKLREWLIPPWFISCQVLTSGCLMVEGATCIVTALIFLHFCPIMNHEYLQTYGMFASASMMFLVTMISFVVAIVFGVQCNDRYWLPRPDQNMLSWGFGFLIISAIFALISGICMFMEGQRTYDALLRKEDEYTKAALEMSAYPVEQSSAYPPVYDPEWPPRNGQPGQDSFGPNYGPPPTHLSTGSHPSSSMEKDPAMFEKEHNVYERDPMAYGSAGSYGQQEMKLPGMAPKYGKRATSDVENYPNS